MTILAEITKGLSICVLDEITNGDVGKGATVPVFAPKIPIGEYEYFLAPTDLKRAVSFET